MTPAAPSDENWWNDLNALEGLQARLDGPVNHQAHWPEGHEQLARQIPLVDISLIRAELPELPEVKKGDVKIPNHRYPSSGWGINE